jgi:hypothetical protein
MGVLPDPTGVVLAGHGLLALLLAAISDAAESETLSDGDLRRRLELALTAGNPEDDHILEVLSQADELLRHHAEQLHRAYTEAGAQRMDIGVPSLRDLVAEPPSWIERYLDFVDRLRATPAVSRELLQTSELACFEALMGGNAWTSPAFDHLFTPEHRNLLSVAMEALREICGESIASRLTPLASLPFDRHAPALPDRRGPTAPKTTTDVPASPLARNPQAQPPSPST